MPSPRDPSPRDGSPSPISPYVTGALGRCPRCGGGRLFSGFLDLAPGCKSCGLDYGFADAGDGPAVFVTLIGGFIVVGAALWADVAFDPPAWLLFAIFLPLTVVVCLGLLRLFKGLLVALQYVNKAEQTPWEK